MTGDKRTGMFGALAEWWRNFRAELARVRELDACGPEVGHIARDVGLSESELRTIAAKRPDAADQLKLRLEAMHLDSAELQRSDPLVMRDLERVCTVCGSKRQCTRDWIRYPDDEAWRAYCPNAQTLDALDGASRADKAGGPAQSRAAD
jgi:hypothetical protein